MNCYDAFDEIVSDFKDVLEHRETTLRKMEERLSDNLREEANVIRRLEHHVEVLRQDAILQRMPWEVPVACSNCRKPLVHEQYSHEIKKGLEVKKERKKVKKDASNTSKRMATATKALSPMPLRSTDFAQQWNSEDRTDFGQQWSPLMLDYPSFSSHKSPYPPSHTFPDMSAHSDGNSAASSDTSSIIGGCAHLRPTTVTFDASYREDTISTEPEDIEKRMRLLNDKVDKVTSKTYRMLSRSSHLNNNSKMLKDQVASLQHDLCHINHSLR